MTDILRVADEYYVRASSALADDRTRVLKCGDTFAVFNRYGDIENLGATQFGLFHADSRYLSCFTLRVNEKQPLLLSSTIRDDNALLSVDLTNVDTAMNGNGTLPRGTVHIYRAKFLRPGSCYEHIRVQNCGLEPVRFTLVLAFDADFADIFEVRGTKRARRGERLPDRVEDRSVILSYRGLDGVTRSTRVEFSPQPESLISREARITIALGPKEETSLYVSISCEQQNVSARLPGFQNAFRSLNRDFEEIGAQECNIVTSSETFNDWLARSAADLRMLIDRNPEGPYPYAGVPWFSTVFGRDGIITALECLWMTPRIAEGVLKYLAQTQAKEEAPEQDADPGKIIHEIRRGEMAMTGEVPFARYYGSVDSTPLFVMLAGAHFIRTGDLAFAKKLWPNVQLALKWIDSYGDCDGDGFVEYRQRSAKGLAQQGWKDSYDSIFHSDGRLAEAPIALCEVQGYVYAAKRHAAILSKALGDLESANKLERDAATLKSKFDSAFWCENLGTYALCLDGKKNQCRVRTSNAGQALFCEIATQEHAEKVSAGLMSEASFSGWGIRTVAATEARYNPMSYHNGSVWPHDNALISMGFSSYHLQDRSSELLCAFHDASRHMELQRLPELFCGFHKRLDASGPTLYPVACAPQAWAAGSVYLFLQSCLGLRVDALGRHISLTNPRMPENLTEVRIKSLRVADAVVDLLIYREGQFPRLEVLRKMGDCTISELF